MDTVAIDGSPSEQAGRPRSGFCASPEARFRTCFDLVSWFAEAPNWPIGVDSSAHPGASVRVPF